MCRSRDRQESHRFIPRLEPLEDRQVPALGVGGIAAQVGSTLTVAVTSPNISTTVIVTDGLGNVAVDWNGGDFQFFFGINNIQVNAQALGNVIALYALAPLQAPEQLSLNVMGLTSVLLAHLPAGGASLTAFSNTAVPFITF